MDPEQMQFFYEIFDSSLPRLGPGDDASTKKALDMLFVAKEQSKGVPIQPILSVLDIGCGNGAQTIQLAKQIDGTILAVDNHQPFLDELQQRAKEAGVADKIQVCKKDMTELGQEQKSYDLIWSEGALYSMGFNESLAMCHDLLAPGGQLAVSELCWFQPDPPAAIRQFFAEEYPAMVNDDANVETIQQCGYTLLKRFRLPVSAWMEGFYLPLEERVQLLRGNYVADSAKLALLDTVQKEIDMYRQYGHYYGYVFYLMEPV